MYLSSSSYQHYHKAAYCFHLVFLACFVVQSQLTLSTLLPTNKMPPLFNFPLPDDFFYQDCRDVGYASSLNRHDSEHSNCSSRSTNSCYSSYSGPASTEPTTHSAQLQQPGGPGHHHHHSDGYPGSSSSNAVRRPTLSALSPSTLPG
jgi:hypothetical protein